MHDNRHAIAFGSLAFLILLIISLIVLGLWAWPKYKLYSKEMSGKAALKEAEWSKKILIEEAKAKEQAALMQAKTKVTLAKAEGKADVERAKAVAEANKIIGESLKGNEQYLRYVWIKSLQDGKGERIYIPTEAGLPILEAGEMKK